MLVTNKTIDYRTAPYGHVATIPAGTEVIPAINLPQEQGNPQYWVMPWKGMFEQEERWQINYGFLLGREDIAFRIPSR